MLPKSGSGGSKPRMGLIKVPLSLKMSFQTTSKNDGLRLVVTFSFLNYILRKLKIFPVQRELHLFSTKESACFRAKESACFRVKGAARSVRLLSLV